MKKLPSSALAESKVAMYGYSPAPDGQTDSQSVNEWSVISR